MKNKTPVVPVPSTPMWEKLESFVRTRVRETVQSILEEEMTTMLGRGRSERRLSVDATSGYRNGFGKSRRLTFSCGTVVVRRPRVRGLEDRFESRVLPLFQRQTREVAALVPEMYLHGLSKGDFELALRGLLGNGAPLSPASIERLRAKWHVEYEEWTRRSLEGRELVYVWADGIYVRAGLEREKACLLVVIGARSDGTKDLLALELGYRESTESWATVLRSLRERGLAAPLVAVGDGGLGLWAALATVFPATRHPRCWNQYADLPIMPMPGVEPAAA